METAKKAVISVHGQVPLPDTVPASDPACLVGLLHVQKSQDFVKWTAIFQELQARFSF